MDVIADVWDRIQVVPEIVLNEYLLLAASGIAALAVVVPEVWRVLRIGVTLVHEFGHALVGVLCGRRFTGFVVRDDMSGETVTVGRATGLGVVLNTWAGYPAPAIAGAGLATAALTGWSAAVLTAILLGLLISLIRVRSLYTALVMGAVVAAAGALWWWRADALQATALLGVATFLILGSWRQCWNVSRSRHSSSDPARLASLTRIPRFGWLITFWLIIGASSLATGWFVLTTLTS